MHTVPNKQAWEGSRVQLYTRRHFTALWEPRLFKSETGRCAVGTNSTKVSWKDVSSAGSRVPQAQALAGRVYNNPLQFG